MMETRTEYRILVGRPLERLRRMWVPVVKYGIDRVQLLILE
jgi:hypothetical protein